jgi:hypothetical protein
MKSFRNMAKPPSLILFKGIKFLSANDQPKTANPQTSAAKDFNKQAPKNLNVKKFDALALWNKFQKNVKSLTPEESAAFVDGCLSSRFLNDARITDPRKKDIFTKLTFNEVTTLYDKITDKPTASHHVYLSTLNKCFDFDKTFYERAAQPMAAFFSPKNAAFIEDKWIRAKAAGQIKSPDSFAKTLGRYLTDEPILGQSDFEDRIHTLQFIVDAYSNFINESSVRFGVFKADANSKGKYINNAVQGEIVAINMLELYNFKSAINVTMHERQHATQMRLAMKLERGLINKTDSSYKAARAFYLNFKENGYVVPTADGKVTMREYINQPIEIDAHYAGILAETTAVKTYGIAPTPRIDSYKKLRVA